MSGLLVKSTAFMKENLSAFNEEGITVPVVLGGAALTPKFVNNDCNNVYKGQVIYGKDAFTDLRFMNAYMEAKAKSKWDNILGFLEDSNNEFNNSHKKQIDSKNKLTTLNPNGRLFPGTAINSSIDTTLDLAVSSLIAVRVKGFLADENQFEIFTNLYSMQEEFTPEEWDQEPSVCSLGQFKTSPTTLSGKVVIMTLPLHDGYRPKLQGNGSSIKLFQYLFDHEF